jgi:hypothetical protein
MLERQDFTIYTGKTKIIRVMTNDNEGHPFDFTGWNVLWIMRSENVTGDVKLTKTSADGITYDPTYLYIRINPANTESLNPGIYYHELSASKDDMEFDICNGIITLKKSGN